MVEPGLSAASENGVGGGGASRDGPVAEDAGGVESGDGPVAEDAGGGRVQGWAGGRRGRGRARRWDGGSPGRGRAPGETVSAISPPAAQRGPTLNVVPPSNTRFLTL